MVVIYCGTLRTSLRFF